jgi:hypothetical protein
MKTLNRDVPTWVRIAGLNEEDIEFQLKCLEEEMIDEWESAMTYEEAKDAYVDADFVRLVLFSLGYRRDDLDDKVITMYEDLVQRYFAGFDVLNDVIVHREKVMTANFAKFVTDPMVAGDTEAHLTMLGIDHYTRYHEGFYMFKSARCQTVNGKHYPRNKILKPVNWRAPE